MNSLIRATFVPCLLLVTTACAPPQVRVTIDPPEARIENARWRIDEDAWQTSDGIMETSYGKHVLSLEDLPHWKAPEPQEIEVTDSFTRFEMAYTFVTPSQLAVLGGVGRIHTLSVSPDEERIALSGEHVIVVDLSTGRVLARFQDQENPVRAVGFDPSGTRIVTGGQDGSLWVRDAMSGERLQELTTQKTGIIQVAYLPDGNRILFIDQAGNVVLYDLVRNQPIRVFDKIYYLQYFSVSANGSRFLVQASGKCKVWETDTGECLWNPPDGFYGSHMHMRIDNALSEDGARMAVLRSEIIDATYSDPNSYLDIYTINTGERVLEFTKSRDEMGGGLIRFLPDGARLRIGNFIWDLVTQQKIASLPEMGGPCAFLASKNAAILSSEGTAIVWDVELQSSTVTLASDVSVSSLLFSAAGDQLWVGRDNGALQKWDVATGTLSCVFEGLKHQQIALSADGYSLIAADIEGAVRRWDLVSCVSGPDLFLPYGSGDLDRVLRVAVSSDGLASVTAGLSGALQLWDLTLGVERAALTGVDDPFLVEFSPNGAFIAVASGTHAALYKTLTGEMLWKWPLWDWSDDEERPSDHYISGVNSISFSQKSDRVAVLTFEMTRYGYGFYDGELLQWNTADGSSAKTISFNSTQPQTCQEGMTYRVVSYEYSGENESPGSLEHGRTELLSLHDSDKVLCELPHMSAAQLVKFSCDCERFATVTGQGLVIVWGYGAENTSQ